MLFWLGYHKFSSAENSAGGLDLMIAYFSIAGFAIWFGAHTHWKRSQMLDVPKDDGTVSAKISMLERDIKTTHWDESSSKFVIASVVVTIIAQIVICVLVPSYVLMGLYALCLFPIFMMLKMHLKRLPLIRKVRKECQEKLDNLNSGKEISHENESPDQKPNSD